MGEVIFQGIQL